MSLKGKKTKNWRVKMSSRITQLTTWRFGVQIRELYTFNLELPSWKPEEIQITVHTTSNLAAALWDACCPVNNPEAFSVRTIIVWSRFWTQANTFSTVCHAFLQRQFEKFCRVSLSVAIPRFLREISFTTAFRFWRQDYWFISRRKWRVITRTPQPH